MIEYVIGAVIGSTLYDHNKKKREEKEAEYQRIIDEKNEVITKMAKRIQELEEEKRNAKENETA